MAGARKRAAPTPRAIRRVHPEVRARTFEMDERADVARERVRVSPSLGTRAPGDADLTSGDHPPAGHRSRYGPPARPPARPDLLVLPPTHRGTGPSPRRPCRVVHPASSAP